jgi:hypothetical protein
LCARESIRPLLAGGYTAEEVGIGLQLTAHFVFGARNLRGGGRQRAPFGIDGGAGSARKIVQAEEWHYRHHGHNDDGEQA